MLCLHPSQRQSVIMIKLKNNYLNQIILAQTLHIPLPWVLVHQNKRVATKFKQLITLM